MAGLPIYPASERVEYSVDEDGVYWTTKHEDEVLLLRIDWTNLLESGETVSSVAYDDDSGLTLSGEALATPVSTVTITGTGEVEVEATLSSGRLLRRDVRYYLPQGRREYAYR